MPSAFAVRHQIEAVLAHRVPSALSPVPRVERAGTTSGIAGLDALLDGGLPVGALTELVGPSCSGRSTAALAYLAAVANTENVCAWIDVSDALDPESAAANGIDLERLLWIRCGTNHEPALRSVVEVRATPPAFSTIPSQLKHTGGGSPHPRSEGRDMPQAIHAMLQAHGGLLDHQNRREKKAIGTPGMPNRPVVPIVRQRVEQVSFDRLPPRRGENLAYSPRCAEPLPKRVAQLQSGNSLHVEDLPIVQQRHTGRPWQALDQAIRAADLLLQNGGFRLIVLDLGDTLPEQAWRIPLATWFRFRAACERTRSSLLLLTQHACARSSAELVVRMKAGCMESDKTVMTGIRYAGIVERTHKRHDPERVVSIRKPTQSEKAGTWRSEAVWAQAK
jgi:recombination protein RecA